MRRKFLFLATQLGISMKHMLTSQMKVQALPRMPTTITIQITRNLVETPMSQNVSHLAADHSAS